MTYRYLKYKKCIDKSSHIINYQSFGFDEYFDLLITKIMPNLHQLVHIFTLNWLPIPEQKTDIQKWQVKT